MTFLCIIYVHTWVCAIINNNNEYEPQSMTIGRKLPIAKYVAFLSLSHTHDTTNPVTQDYHSSIIYFVYKPKVWISIESFTQNVSNRFPSTKKKCTYFYRFQTLSNTNYYQLPTETHAAQSGQYRQRTYPNHITLVGNVEYNQCKRNDHQRLEHHNQKLTHYMPQKYFNSGNTYYNRTTRLIIIIIALLLPISIFIFCIYSNNLPDTKLLSNIPSFLSINIAPDVKATAKKNIILKFDESLIKFLLSNEYYYSRKYDTWSCEICEVWHVRTVYWRIKLKSVDKIQLHFGTFIIA